MGTISRVDVVGGGVGGLALGRALARAGMDTTIYEKRDRYGPTGLGLLLLPNGLQALDELGLGDDARTRSNPIDLAVIRSHEGRALAQFPLEEHRGIARHDLLTMLETGVPEGAVAWSHPLSDLRQQPDQVAFEVGGSWREADILVAADGANSFTRRFVAPDWDRRPCLVAELVSVCDAPDLAALYDRTFVKHVRPGVPLAVGLVPAAYGQVVWFVQFSLAHAPPVPKAFQDKRAYLEELLRGFGDPVPELVERTDYVHTHLWMTPAPGPIVPLNHGRVVLIGDASHPFPTLTSQGANCAMMDAVVLARHLAMGGSRPETLEAFAAERQPRLDAINAGGEALVAAFLAAEDNEILPMIQ